MKITQEADYALRIVMHLSKLGGRAGSGDIASSTAVSPRFATKILRKLMLAGIVRSYKGATGGYALAKAPADITLLDVITVIDGDIRINRCIGPGGACTRLDAGAGETCSVHDVLSDINNYIEKQLSSVNFSNIDTLCGMK